MRYQNVHQKVIACTYIYTYVPIDTLKKERNVFNSWEDSGERVHWGKGDETGKVDVKKKKEWPFSWIHTVDKFSQIQELLPWNWLRETVKGVSGFIIFMERMGIKWRVEIQISHRDTEGISVWDLESIGFLLLLNIMRNWGMGDNFGLSQTAELRIKLRLPDCPGMILLPHSRPPAHNCDT